MDEMSHNPFDFFGGISNFFNNVCTPEICTARHDHGMSIYDHEASNSPPRVDDERFMEMGSEEGIQRSFTSFSSASSSGRAIERSGFPRFCKYFFNRVDPSYSPTADDMNTLWDFFDREKAGRIDLFEFGLGIRQLLPHRGGKRALIMVDFQRDFVDGSLRVADGIEAVRQANRIRDRFDKQLIWLTRDWHPADHMSFHDNHGIYTYRYTHTHIHTHTHTHTHTHIHIHTYIRICMYVCMYVCIYVYVWSGKPDHRWGKVRDSKSLAQI